ncbi:glycerophosphoryl diester phosphodiesterase [Geomicrobium sp. JCM 19037]|uniref:glycerophosphodiester phosphodiesterase family protein n=1 Tax=Geomicrobium sp. JCM 19037 TaxID=1460634 RepID=UPI00045F2272|nr:glycerophosphodiester phosphodiesterase family protein [Geomicrobium sp. JCM 19037]GAK04128.1 glycerophosphoryl diester phosphodiesterase [Geomicrobium sp. JCM 19037]
MYIAHRGYSANAPENTVAAFQQAVHKGADGIELDVHRSLDGELIVIHDEWINRTTNGEGKVADMTLGQLKAHDAGSWYSEAYRGEKIPTLSEVFECMPKETVINVEIKNIPSFYEGIEELVVQAIQTYERMELRLFLPLIIILLFA